MNAGWLGWRMFKPYMETRCRARPLSVLEMRSSVDEREDDLYDLEKAELSWSKPLTV